VGRKKENPLIFSGFLWRWEERYTTGFLQWKQEKNGTIALMIEGHAV
jgi:hypothetical protein